MTTGKDVENKCKSSLSSLSEDPFELMKDAIINVKANYVIALSEYYVNNKIRKKFVNLVERSFAYELYHQLRNLLVQEPGNLNEIYVHAEIPKGSDSRTFPDIILHGGHTDTNKQLMVCEIKRNTNKKKPNKSLLKGDLEKLVYYMENLQYENRSVGFDFGCLIVVGTSKKDLQVVVKSILLENESFYKQSASRIILFSYSVEECVDNNSNSDNSYGVVESFRLNELYDEK